MKKTSTISTVVMFLIAILIAWGCNKKNADKVSKKDEIYNKVVIYLRTIDINGTIFLYMYDSNGSTYLDDLSSIDTLGLVTDVKPGTEVFWQLERNSEIKEIVKISSKGNKNIFKEDPTPIVDTSAIDKPSDKVFWLKLKDSVEGKEKYDISIKLKNDTEIIRDPYLRVPPPPGKD